MKIFTKRIQYCFQCPHYVRNTLNGIVYEECGEDELTGAADGVQYLLRETDAKRIRSLPAVQPPEFCPLPSEDVPP